MNYFLPGFKAGGPIRTVAGIVHHLKDEFDFAVITRDRDSGDRRSYPGVVPDTWTRAYGAHVFYASPRTLDASTLTRLLRSVPCDVLYLNSFFNARFGVAPVLARAFRLLPRVPLVLAPRGEFTPGALRVRWPLKRLYMEAVKRLGMLDEAVWHVTDETEAALLPEGLATGRVHAASNLRLPLGPGAEAAEERIPKRPGELRAVFVSRITRKKNLLEGLRCFASVRGDVHLDVYGAAATPEDGAYLAACRRAAADLPPHVRVTFHGAVPPAEVEAVLGRSHLFFLPTLGENFGHAVLEALVSGCPVLVSDRTPWRDLATRYAGWDLPLHDPRAFDLHLQRVVDMDEATWLPWSRGARALGRASINPPEAIEQNRSIFRSALDGASASHDRAL